MAAARDRELPSSYAALLSSALQPGDKTVLLADGRGPATTRRLLRSTTEGLLAAMDATEASERQQLAAEATFHASVDGLARESWAGAPTAAMAAGAAGGRQRVGAKLSSQGRRGGSSGAPPSRPQRGAGALAPSAAPSPAAAQAPSKGSSACVPPWDDGDTAIRGTVAALPPTVSGVGPAGSASDAALRIQTFSHVSLRRIVDVLVACCQDEIRLEITRARDEARAAGEDLSSELASLLRTPTRQLDVDPTRVAAAAAEVNGVLAAYATVLRATFRLYAAIEGRPRRPGQPASRPETAQAEGQTAADESAGAGAGEAPGGGAQVAPELVMDSAEFQRFLRETRVVGEEQRAADFLQSQEATTSEARQRRQRAAQMGARGYMGGRRASLPSDGSSSDEDGAAGGMILLRKGGQAQGRGLGAELRRFEPKERSKLTAQGALRIFALVNRPVLRQGVKAGALSVQRQQQLSGAETATAAARRRAARAAVALWDGQDGVVGSDEEDAEAEAASPRLATAASSGARKAAAPTTRPPPSSLHEMLVAAAKRWEVADLSAGIPARRKLRGAVHSVIAMARVAKAKAASTPVADATQAATSSFSKQGRVERLKAAHSASLSAARGPGAGGRPEPSADAVARALRAAGGGGAGGGRGGRGRAERAAAAASRTLASSTPRSVATPSGPFTPLLKGSPFVPRTPGSALSRQLSTPGAGGPPATPIGDGDELDSGSDASSDGNGNDGGEALDGEEAGSGGQPVELNPAEAANPDDALNAREFVEALVRLAARRFSGKRSRQRSPSLAERLRRLIERHVLRGMHAADPVAFRRTLASRPVAAALASARLMLRRAFLGYCLIQHWADAAAAQRKRPGSRRALKDDIADPSRAQPGGAQGLQLRTWLRLMGDAGAAVAWSKQRMNTRDVLRWVVAQQGERKAGGPSAAVSKLPGGHKGSVAAASHGTSWVSVWRLGLERLSCATAKRLFRDAQATHAGRSGGDLDEDDEGVDAQEDEDDDVDLDDDDDADRGADGGSSPKSAGSRASLRSRSKSPPALRIQVDAEGSPAAQSTTAKTIDDDAVMIESEFAEAVCAAAVHAVPDPMLSSAMRATVFVRALASSPAMGLALDALAL
ncbi:hypothetical protein FNF31_01710 [Cafeteria roenbergensis]|uniref:Uncharacterized protein n=2 Tax=Cafeteria roenbergensis TaxID=33653 RepID=A0A5A8DJN6_CAFRO|nr:hypothetical protein FNF31_01710 [Cafeteria roenbergensis]